VGCRFLSYASIRTRWDLANSGHRAFDLRGVGRVQQEFKPARCVFDPCVVDTRWGGSGHECARDEQRTGGSRQRAALSASYFGAGQLAGSDPTSGHAAPDGHRAASG
jgi:hypothetical protein